MRKLYALVILFLLLSFTVVGQSTSQKIILSPSMITNESEFGDAGMLVDEQALANDPLNGAGGVPETNWFPGWGDRHPVSAYIDLGKVYELTHVSLYDNNGKGDFIVEQGSPGNWVPLFTDPLNYYQVWNNNNVSATTRYLRFTRVATSSNAHELVLYGSIVNTPPVLTAIEEQVVGEGETLTLLLTATDPDNDLLSFSLDSAAEFIALTDNGDGTATLTANPPNGSAEVYTVNITVTDNSGGETIESFVLTVESSETGDPPSSDALQVIGIDLNDWRGNPPSNWNELSSAAVSATPTNLKNYLQENTGYSIEVVDNFNGIGLSGLSTGNDSGPVPDGVMSTFWYNQHDQGILKFVLDKTKKYTFKIYGGRDGTNDDKSADYTIGEQTVSLYNFNNTQNAAIIQNVIPDANNEVFLLVKNSTGYIYAILNGIVIEEYPSGLTNTPPVLASIGNQTVTEGEVLNIPLSATDAEGDLLTFSLTTSADFISFIDNGDGTAELSLSPGYLEADPYEAAISVNDGNGGIANETFTITVNSNPGGTPQAGDFRTIASGDWHDYTVWQKYDATINNWVETQTGELPDVNVNVFLTKGLSLVLNQPGSCKNLNIDGESQVRNLDVTDEVLDVWGQLRFYAGVVPGITTRPLVLPQTPGQWIHSNENSEGRVRFRGSSNRTIIPQLSTGAPLGLCGWTMEIAFDPGIIGHVYDQLRIGDLIITSGILRSHAESIRPSGWQLSGPTGKLTIKSNGRLIGGRGLYRGSKTAFDTFILEEGGVWEINAPEPVFAAQNISIAGTVIFSGTGNQYFPAIGGRSYATQLNTFYDLIVDNGGVKSLRNNITINGTLQELNGATIGLNGYNVQMVTPLVPTPPANLVQNRPTDGTHP